MSEKKGKTSMPSAFIMGASVPEVSLDCSTGATAISSKTSVCLLGVPAQLHLGITCDNDDYATAGSKLLP